MNLALSYTYSIFLSLLSHFYSIIGLRLVSVGLLSTCCDVQQWTFI
jgi:hypothetical protein